MSKTISANSGAVKLTSTADNPLIVLGGVTVSGSGYGVYGNSNQAWTITNQGTVIGAPGDGVDLVAGGMVRNGSATARISAGANGVKIINGPGTIANQGTISGASGYGVFLNAGGAVTNTGTAADIAGGKWGVFVVEAAPTTITNSGTISGTTGAVHFADADGNVFRLLPGAVTTGIVQGGAGVDTLALGTAHSFGIISGIGAQFTGFEVLEVDASAIGLVTAANTLGTYATIDLIGNGSLRVTGTLVAPANLTITGDGTFAAGGGRIEVGTSGAALGSQIVVDAGHTLFTSGALVAKAIKNNGTISGSYGFGVHLAGTGQVANSGAGAHITGTDAGVLATGGGLTVSNSGTAAQITGGLWGVYAASASTITNLASIAGTYADGVYLAAGGSVANSGSGSVVGGMNGVNAMGAATVTNLASITGTAGNGVYLGAGGVVANNGSAASIAGGQWAVYATAGAATVSNSGTLTGATGAVSFANVNGNVFHDFAGGVTNGVVQGGNATDTLELGPSPATGTISGIGTLFTGFELLMADAAAHWSIAGANRLRASGTIDLEKNSSLGVTGTLSAPGNLIVTGTGTLATSGGRIEIGTSGGAAANQIRVDNGHTLSGGAGVLSAPTLFVASTGLLEATGLPSGASGPALTITGDVAGGGTLAVSNPIGFATLELRGLSNAIGTVALNGRFVELGAGDTLNVTGLLDSHAGGGTFILDNNSLLQVAAATGGGDVSVSGPNGELVVDHVGQFGTNVGGTNYSGPVLEHFGGVGEKIDLRDLNFAGLTFNVVNANPEQLQLASGATKATLLFFDLKGSAFHFANDGTGHVLVTHT